MRAREIQGLLAVLAVVSVASPRASAEELGPGEVDFEQEQAHFEWSRVGAQDDDLAVVEVLAIPEGRTTNGAPPTVEVRVVRLLNGNAASDRSKVTWRAAWPFGFGICGNDHRIAPWQEAEFKEMPKVGETFIVSMDPARAGTLPAVSGNCRVPYTAEKLKEIQGWFTEGREGQKEFEAGQAREARRRLEAAQAFWARKAAASDPADLFSRADIIATGKIASGLGAPVSFFEFSEVLRSPGLREDGGVPGFVAVKCPAGGEEAFQPGMTFLLVLKAQGVSGWTGEPCCTLFEGELGIFELTDARLEAAREWVRAHPADPATDKETVARCRAWSAARSAECAFQHPDSGFKYGNEGLEYPLADQEAACAERFRRLESFLKPYPADVVERARRDPRLLATRGRWLLRHARIVALRATGLESRGGAAGAIDPKLAEALRTKAVRLVRDAAATGTVTRAELAGDPELATLRSQPGWEDVLKSLPE